jgi:hypothetical protein
MWNDESSIDAKKCTVSESCDHDARGDRSAKTMYDTDESSEGNEVEERKQKEKERH